MTARPHLVFVSGTALYGKNGSSQAEAALARALSDRYQITLMSRGETRARPDEPFQHQLYQRPSSRDWKTILFLHRVRAQLEELHRARPIALVHGFQFFPVALYLERGPWPFVLTHHNMELWPAGGLARRRTLRAVRAARRIVCLNPVQRERLLEVGIPEAQLTVIENGVEVGPGAPSPVPLPPRYLLFAGRFEAEKGLPLLLDAYQAIPPAERPALVLAGEERGGTALSDRARALGAILTGWLDRPQLTTVLRGAEALLLPTQSEASPLLLLEAYALGVPVIAHALPELAGGPFEPIAIGDLGAWTKALALGVDRRQRDAERIEKALKHAEKRSWRAVSEAYLAVYGAALGLA